MRTAAVNRSKSPEFLAKLSAAQSNSIKIEVTNLEKSTTTIYNAIRAAARALGIDKRYIEHYVYLNQEKPVLGKYVFKLLNSDTKDLNPEVRIQKTSKKLEVTNVNTHRTIVYCSISAAARELGIRQPVISLYMKENRSKPFKGIYPFDAIRICSVLGSFTIYVFTI